jgi:allantoinase
VVHVSCGEALEEIHAAKRRGVDVTAETCPHYLLLNAEDAVRIGADAKCAPPLRSEAVRADLVKRVLAGDYDTLGTDHSPCPPTMKHGTDFFQVWGGIMGAQQFLPALCAAGLSPMQIVELASRKVAARFGLASRKGEIRVGMDADLVLLDGREKSTVRTQDLLTRHATSAYVGRAFPASVSAVWVRGVSAWSRAGGRGEARGRLVRPGV